jgi:hypothetical protein
VSAHAVIRQVIPAGREETFDLLHDYLRRLTWDTLLRRAYTVGDAPPGPGVEAVCQARRSLGGLTFRTRYVTFRRPELAAVTLVEPAPLFASWAASIRHLPLDSGRHEIAYTLTFRCRPALLAPVIERVALLAFRWEIRRRLRALAAAVGGDATPPRSIRTVPRRR